MKPHQAEQFELPLDKKEGKWKRSETDRMLDLYLSGKSIADTAHALGRDPEETKQRLGAFATNLDGRAERYEPYRREVRAGMRLSKNEITMIRAYRTRGIGLGILAKVFMREAAELGLDVKDLADIGDMRRVGVGVDLVLAYRFLYYVQGISILSDQAYDALEKEEIEFGACGQLLERVVGSDRAEDYPPHIRGLAIYLAFKYGRKK